MNHDNGNRVDLDHLFEIGLLLVTVLSAAELQFAGIVMGQDTAGLNFIFRITTTPIIILVVLWLVKEFCPARLERRVPLKRGLKEFGWIFLGQFIALALIVYFILSFYASIADFLFWADILALLAIVLTFPVTLEYRKFDFKRRDGPLTRRFYAVSVGEHVVWSVVAYLVLTWVIEAMATIPL
jgi:small-conductance mechanosensitive channel